MPRKRPGPAGGIRDRNRRENLQHLCDAALALFLAEGTAGVTIDDIVDRAGMAKGSFYRYVADKPELVAHIIAPVAAELISALDRCERALTRAQPDALAAVYLQLGVELSEVLQRHVREVLLYLQEARAPASGARVAIHALADQLTARAIALTEVAHGHALIRNVDPRIAALTVTGAIESLLFAYLRGRKTLPVEISTITHELVTLVLRGIRG